MSPRDEGSPQGFQRHGKSAGLAPAMVASTACGWLLSSGDTRGRSRKIAWYG